MSIALWAPDLTLILSSHEIGPARARCLELKLLHLVCLELCQALCFGGGILNFAPAVADP